MINDSNISNISIIGRNQNGAASPAVTRAPKPSKRTGGGGTTKKAKGGGAASPVSATNGGSGGARPRGIKESLSQISLRTQKSLRSSMRRMAPAAGADPPMEQGGESAAKRVPVGRIEPILAVTENGQPGAEVNEETQGKLKKLSIIQKRSR